MTTGILGVGMLGGAAFAAFAPAPTDTFSLVPELSGSALTAAAPKHGNDKLKDILDALVTKGVITQAQEDAILAAIKDGEHRDDALRHVFAGLFDQSATYLGMKPAELKANVNDPREMERLAKTAEESAHRRWLVSSNPDEHIAQLRPYLELGFRHLVFHAPGDDQSRFIELYGSRILPRIRERWA